MQVMFVDDENRILSGIERSVMMYNPDWECRFASSGPQALTMLEETPADVVVSDMRMPFMDGAELLAQIRDRWPGTVRIILSGYSEPTSTQRMLQVAHQFVSKPCDSTALIAMIENTLTRRHAIEDPRSLTSWVISATCQPRLRYSPNSNSAFPIRITISSASLNSLDAIPR
jgi:YesN/AraC family two-component response regulator